MRKFPRLAGARSTLAEHGCSERHAKPPLSGPCAVGDIGVEDRLAIGCAVDVGGVPDVAPAASRRCERRRFVSAFTSRHSVGGSSRCA